MPCLILTGHPRCGKSTLAKAIEQRALLRSDISNVLILTDIHGDKDNEKATRAELKSQFDRHASSAASSTLIIVDAMNAIKGYRYELYCISKTARQTHGVVWVMNSISNCLQYNASSRHYTDDQLRDLMQRYEPPDDRNRWDQPLFRVDVRPDDERLQSLDTELLQQSIYDMHSLKDALRTIVAAEEVARHADTQTKEAAADGKHKKKGSSFKRAVKSTSTAAAPKPTRPVTVPKLDAAYLQSLEQQSATFVSLDAIEADDDSRTAMSTIPRALTRQQRYEENLSLPLEERIDRVLDMFLTSTKRLEQSMSTQQNIASDSNVLHVIDMTTQQIMTAIFAAQEAHRTDCTDPAESLLLQLPGMPSATLQPTEANMSADELRQRRQQYLKWTRLYPPDETTLQAIMTAFLEYIQQHTVDE